MKGYYRLSRNDSAEEGSATVSVAAIGVPPMASGTRGTEPNGEWSCAAGWSAGRRPVRPRRSRSPFRTESLRLSEGIVAALLFLGAEWHGVSAGFNLNVGDILVANNNLGTVLKIDPVTRSQQILGDTFSAPTDLVLDASGYLYVSELGGAIKRLDVVGGSLTTVLDSGNGPSQVWGITMGPSGDLFVTSRGNNSVYRVNVATGAATLLSQSNSLSGPTGIDVLDSNHLVVASLFNNQLVSVSLADGSQSVIAGVEQPRAVAVRDGDIYVTAYEDKKILRVSGGAVTTAAWTPYDYYPHGLALETNGNFVVGLADNGGATVVRLRPPVTPLDAFVGPLISIVTGVEVSRISVTPLNVTIFPTTTNTAVVSWPLPSTGYVLQQTSALGTTNSNWVNTTNAVTVVSNRNQVIVSPSGQKGFYRLFHP